MERRAVPGSVLVHLGPAAAAALVAANDLWIREHAPAWLGGKLSGLGIAFLLPVALTAAWEWISWLAARLERRSWRPPGRPLHLAASATTVLYAGALELVPGFGAFHRAWLEALFPWLGFRAATPDPTDLACLLAVPLAYVHLRRWGPDQGDASRA